MKRLVLCVLIMALLSACAPQVVPTPSIVERIVEKEVVKEVLVKPVQIRWLTETDPNVCYWLAQQYRAKANVDVVILPTQAPDGTTSEMDAMFASGAAPNVYTAYGGRTSKYFDEATPLSIEEAKFIPGILDLCKNSKGQVVAVPYAFWVQFGSINLDLVSKYGLEKYLPTTPERTWTIAQFEALATAFKAVCAKDEFPGMVYAASGSGDYWVQLWEKGLGAHPLYDAAGKLDVAPLAKAWSKFQEYVDKGWFPSGVEGLNDDHFCAAMVAGKLLFFGKEPASHGTMAFRTELVSYPSLDGSFVPAAIGPSSSIVIGGYDAEKDKAAQAFVEWISGVDQVKAMLASQATSSPRLDLVLNYNSTMAEGEMKELNKDGVARGTAALAEHGVINTGIGSVKYQAIRTLRAQKFAEFMAGKPLDKALAEFQAEGDAIFAQ